jgi:NADH-quinone oxidoreductase subunit L
MEILLPIFITVPLIAACLVFATNNKKEKLISYIVITTLLLHFIGLIIFLIAWAASGFNTLSQSGPFLYKTNTAGFSLHFFFDTNAAVYLFVSALLTLLLGVFSRYYMHREKGFKRFFANLLFFYAGLNTVILAGNFETLFIGWEILGITSFFLIAFYNDRYLPVKNALKVVSLYRLADVALLLGIWLCHHYFEVNIHFENLISASVKNTVLIDNPAFQFAIPLVFLLAAMVKSAQFPFSSWLPRAMEGPSTSSAIFYGSLSVHIGVFLLLRTWPFWHSNVAFKAIVIAIGVITLITSTITARVQSSVKTQIAYSSIAQIGIIWVEVALGFHWLAYIHFAGNAFLRCYQLLVSPSVLSYRIHDQFFNFIMPQHNIKNSFLGKLKMTVFMLGVKEWNLDRLLMNSFWKPFKQLGNALKFIKNKALLFIFIPFFLVGLFFVHNKQLLPKNVLYILPVLYSILALVMIIKAFTERKFAKASWLLVIISQLFTSLSIGFNEQFDFQQVYVFLSGIFICGVFGFLCLRKLRKMGKDVSLHQFQGYSYEHPRLAFVFLVAALGLAGFPITPTFIGEDFIIGHIHTNQFALTGITALCLLFDGVVVFRIYARLFLGPHEKGYHETAYRSS